jgi:hypothetical protein
MQSPTEVRALQLVLPLDGARGVAVHVDPFQSKGLKPGYHFEGTKYHIAGSRVVSWRLFGQPRVRGRLER